MKRILAWVISLLTVFSAVTLTACGPKRSQDIVYVTIIEAGLGVEWIETLAANYQLETGTTVEVYSTPDLQESLELAIANGVNLDDLYLSSDTTNIRSWSRDGKLVSLDDVFADTEAYGTSIDSYVLESTAPIGIYQGSRYVTQYTYNPLGFVYNYDMLEQLWENDPQLSERMGEDPVFPKKWSDLLFLCDRVNAAGLTVNGQQVKPLIWGGASVELAKLTETLWVSQDIPAMEERRNYSDLTGYKEELYVNDAHENALKAVYELLKPIEVDGQRFSDNSVRNSPSLTNIDAETAFLNGYALFCPTGAWFESEMSSLIDDSTFDYRFAVYPHLDEVETQYSLINVPTEFWMIPAEAQNIEGAKAFLQYILQPENLALAHEIMQSPLAYEYDKSEILYTDWGRGIMDVLENSQPVFDFALSDLAQAGASPSYVGGDIWLRMIQDGEITADNLREKIIVPAYNERVATWESFIATM